MRVFLIFIGVLIITHLILCDEEEDDFEEHNTRVEWEDKEPFTNTYKRDILRPQQIRIRTVTRTEIPGNDGEQHQNGGGNSNYEDENPHEEENGEEPKCNCNCKQVCELSTNAVEKGATSDGEGKQPPPGNDGEQPPSGSGPPGGDKECEWVCECLPIKLKKCESKKKTDKWKKKKKKHKEVFWNRVQKRIYEVMKRLKRIKKKHELLRKKVRKHSKKRPIKKQTHIAKDVFAIQKAVYDVLQNIRNL